MRNLKADAYPVFFYGYLSPKATTTPFIVIPDDLVIPEGEAIISKMSINILGLGLEILDEILAMDAGAGFANQRNLVISLFPWVPVGFCRKPLLTLIVNQYGARMFGKGYDEQIVVINPIASKHLPWRLIL